MRRAGLAACRNLRDQRGSDMSVTRPGHKANSTVIGKIRNTTGRARVRMSLSAQGDMTTTNGKLRLTDGVWPAGFEAVERIVFDLGYRAGWDARSWRRALPWPVQQAVVRMLD